MFLKIEKKFDDVNNCVRVTFDLNLSDEEQKALRFSNIFLSKENHGSLSFLLSDIFVYHAMLYRYMNISKEDQENYHPMDRDFSCRCGGYNQFLKDVFGKTLISEFDEQQLKVFFDALMAKFNQLFNLYDEAVADNFEISSTMTLDLKSCGVEQDLSKIGLTELHVDNKPMIITNNGCFKVTLEKTDVKDYTELTSVLSNSIKGSYESQLNIKLLQYKTTIEELEKKIEEDKKAVFKESLNLIGYIQDNNWVINKKSLSYRGENKKGKIYATKIVKNGVIYDIPEECKNDFYISGIKINFEDVGNDMCVDRVYCASTSHHPNANGSDICMGSLEFKPLITVIKEFPKILEICNMDSSYDNLADGECDELLSLSNMTKNGVNIWKC